MVFALYNLFSTLGLHYLQLVAKLSPQECNKTIELKSYTSFCLLALFSLFLFSIYVLGMIFLLLLDLSRMLMFHILFFKVGTHMTNTAWTAYYDHILVCSKQYQTWLPLCWLHLNINSTESWSKFYFYLCIFLLHCFVIL